MSMIAEEATADNLHVRIQYDTSRKRLGTFPLDSPVITMARQISAKTPELEARAWRGAYIVEIGELQILEAPREISNKFVTVKQVAHCRGYMLSENVPKWRPRNVKTFTYQGWTCTCYDFEHNAPTIKTTRGVYGLAPKQSVCKHLIALWMQQDIVAKGIKPAPMSKEIVTTTNHVWFPELQRWQVGNVDSSNADYPIYQEPHRPNLSITFYCVFCMEYDDCRHVAQLTALQLLQQEEIYAHAEE